jgi:adenylate cyclase
MGTDPDSAPARRLTNARVSYLPRVAGCALFIAMLLSIAGGAMLPAQLATAAFCLVWPHLAYWRAQRRGGDVRDEYPNALVDCALGGLLAVLFSLRLWPTVAVYSIGVINALLFGGPRALILTFVTSACAFLLAGLALGFHFHAETEAIPTAISIVSILLYIGVLGNATYRNRLRHREARAALKKEREQMHALLLNVFPAAVVPRLQAEETPIADRHEVVTVIFVDIVGFTPMSERLGAKTMVSLLNTLFGKFDAAAAKLGVEKIETTGDGYLAVAGAPAPRTDHASSAALFAFAAIAAAGDTLQPDGTPVAIRIGLHTGPIYAGVVGQSRFHYKIFGATVNVASRIQSQAVPGRILVSNATREFLAEDFILVEHGTIDLKGHGPERTFWLEGRK